MISSKTHWGLTFCEAAAGAANAVPIAMEQTTARMVN